MLEVGRCGGLHPFNSPRVVDVFAGFVWDKEGHLVTSLHVVKGSSDVRVIPSIKHIHTSLHIHTPWRDGHGESSSIPGKLSPNAESWSLPRRKVSDIVSCIPASQV